MKIIITNRFQKEYLNNLEKYFNIETFITKIKLNEHKFISLHHPFSKFKIKINLVDFRGVIAIIDDEKFIPIFIFLKKDKKYGENLSWELTKKLIEKEFLLNIDNIDNGDFNIY